MNPQVPSNNRILIVDDNESIHTDFEKVLLRPASKKAELAMLLDEVLEPAPRPSEPPPARVGSYEIAHAFSGNQAYDLVAAAEQEQRPFALIFMDVRMPPGADGIETTRRIWNDFPHPEVVICTAFSDYSWEEILEILGSTDQLQFLRKPFDVVSIKQMALALCKKWNLAQETRDHARQLEGQIAARTAELTQKISELEKAMAEISQLRGILPMCVYCHKVRDDQNFWQQVDDYIRHHTLAEVSHGICPDCYAKVMADFDKQM